MVASESKIGYHTEKLAQYIRGNPVYPVTLELDLTSACSRICFDCPSARSPVRQELDLRFVANLFDSFEQQTKGLLLTGGEPTLSPLFPEVLKLAREKGFRDIAVVTNGSELDNPLVADALLSHASTIRLSLYDWNEEECHDIGTTLLKIERLRRKIGETGSSLKIGISALTESSRIKILPEITDRVRDAGAHWIYFHPMCSGWTNARLKQLPQDGVLEAVGQIRSQTVNGFGIFVSKARYAESRLSFNRYHAAHFLLVVGSDGKNYLGAEVKYNPAFAIADIRGNWSASFLRDDGRIRRISEINSNNYPAIGSRHRGVLYNDYIEKIMNAEFTLTDPRVQHNDAFWFPHIL